MMVIFDAKFKNNCHEIEIEENTLILCCGKFPSGTIKKAKLAYGLKTVFKYNFILQVI